MCAILTWAGRLKRGQWRPVHQLLTEMLVASACRGTDATGFAALDRRHGFIIDKRACPSYVFAATSPAWAGLSYPSCLIAHCRAATHGSPHTGDNRNNHPFQNDRLAVVVNGVAANYRSVAATRGFRLSTECDSEVILRLVETARTVPQGLRDCLGELAGGMAAAALDADHGCVWLMRNTDRPAWLLRLAGVDGWFVCSTREIAERAVTKAYGRTGLRMIAFLAPLAADTVVRINGDGTLLAASEQFRPHPIVRGPRLV